MMTATQLGIRIERLGLLLDVPEDAVEASHVALDLTLEYLREVAAGNVDDPAGAARELLVVERKLDALREHYSDGRAKGRVCVEEYCGGCGGEMVTLCSDCEAEMERDDT